MSFLAIDIGNTRLKWALYAHPQPGAAMLGHGAVFLERLDSLHEAQWQGLPPPDSMLGTAVAGDVVRLRAEEQLELWGDVQPRWIHSTAHEAGVTNGYEHPGRLGTDRWAALIGARAHAAAQAPKGGAPRPALVVMVGTAVTVDALDASGCFLGGLILPGFGLMQRALEIGTAGLKVPTGELVDFPTNTSDALMSGGLNALAGAVERQFRKLHAHTGVQPLLLMSGGAAVRLAPVIDLPIARVDSLVFDGLLVIQSHRLAL